ncbi:integrase core domain-containing protein [bacterium]|nr:integrase core domain-containing protein [bacterium]
MFTNRFAQSNRELVTLFEKTAAELGIQHKLIRPYTPRRHNGKVERSHREDQHRFYDSNRFYSLADFDAQLAVHRRASNNCPNCPMCPLQYSSPQRFPSLLYRPTCLTSLQFDKPADGTFLDNFPNI